MGLWSSKWIHLGQERTSPWLLALNPTIVIQDDKSQRVDVLPLVSQLFLGWVGVLEPGGWDG